MIKEIGISKLFKYYINDELSIKNSKRLFKDQYKNLEEKRYELKDQEFIQRLNKDDKMIYSTQIKSSLSYIISFLIFIVSLIPLFNIYNINQIVIISILEIILLSILSYIISSLVIKQCMKNFAISHDLRLISKVINQAYWDKENVLMLFKYIDYEKSNKDYLVFNINQKGITNINSIPNREDQSVAKQLYKNERLYEDEIKQYMSIQLKVIDILNKNNDLNYPDIKKYKNFNELIKYLSVFIEKNGVQ